jgi:hypothetical protein
MALDLFRRSPVEKPRVQHSILFDTIRQLMTIFDHFLATPQPVAPSAAAKSW